MLTLERVLGLTTSNTNGLACNPVTGIIAYPAGCVVVLYDPHTNLQTHIFNPEKKTITCVAFSSDGKYLVTGESGVQPSVRIWELSESFTQIKELRGHKSGITSVAFSPNQKLLVSIGDQHDMLVNVWNWKLGYTVACNKSGCRVRAVSFSPSGKYLVTVGNRHVKFWYLDSEASTKGTTSSTTPISGRSGILGDQRNNCFTDVKCGCGKSSSYTYCVTKSGLLCMFSEKRILDKWVELKSGSTNCLAVTENYIFCGSSDGVIRVFEPNSLRYITTLPKPHQLGVNVTEVITPSDLGKGSKGKPSPDLVALTINEKSNKLTCVYNDHSLYIWDTHDLKKVGKTASFLYHSACIWGVETYPYFDDTISALLPYGSFLTCSSDDTIRIWNLEKGGVTAKAYPRNLYSKELLKIVYIDEELTNIQDTSMVPYGKEADGKNGVRCMQISGDGQLLATGDRSGNLRIYDLQFFDETIRIEAHESEILCVEFSSPQSGYQFLASSSRDRLIHIFDIKNDYALLQTIDDHSSSITAVRFNFDINTLQLLSCGADKVVMFHTAQTAQRFFVDNIMENKSCQELVTIRSSAYKTSSEKLLTTFDDSEYGQVSFIRNTIVPGKATLYDMGIEPTRKFAATVGQDRNLRIYDIQGAKQVQSYKGSLSEEGNLIKFQLDDAGVYAAVSCSDKTIAIFDFETGDCEAAVYGHSELVTGLKFTADGKRLISVSGDGCIFVWTLSMSLTENIRSRLQDLHLPVPIAASQDYQNADDLRRKTFIIPSTSSMSQIMEHAEEDEFGNQSRIIEASGMKTQLGYRFSVGQLPLWAQKQIGAGDSANKHKGSAQPLGKWGERNEVTNLNTVPEKTDAHRPNHSGSVDSLASASSDRSCFEEQFPQDEVIYPPSSDELVNNDSDGTFRVTETRSYRLSRDSLEKVDPSRERPGSINIESESDWNEGETDQDEPRSETESDDEAFSPLLDHFEKLATPSSDTVSDSSKPRSRSGSTTSENEGNGFRARHRASISAKFLSRSQRAPRSQSSSSSDDHKKRLEALKAKFMSGNKKSSSSMNLETASSNTYNKHRRSSDVTSPLLTPKNKAREAITTLRKNKLVSQSCQNLHTAQFLQNNQIPPSPSYIQNGDPMLNYDPRRSSTPMHSNLKMKVDKSQKRRSVPNAWGNHPLSPVRSPANSDFNIPNKNVSDKVVLRNKGKSRPRPKSLMVESPAQFEFRNNQNLIPQSHSDNEADDTRDYITNELIRHMTPIKERNSNYSESPEKENEFRREASPSHVTNNSGTTINAHLPSRNINIDTNSANDVSKLKNSENILRVAEEISSNVRTLGFVSNDKSIMNNRPSEDGKRLLLTFETNASPPVLQGSPPERDTPSFDVNVTVTNTTTNLSSNAINASLSNLSSNSVKVHSDISHTPVAMNKTSGDIANRSVGDVASRMSGDMTTNGDIHRVSVEECQTAMKSLVQSYTDAQKLLTKVLSEKPSEHQRQLLSVIMKTYKAIEGNMGEQNKKISANLDLAERHSQIQESDTFKEFQKSLDLLVEQSPNSTATDMLLILDKYSNVLIDIISSKVTKRETLIE